MSNGEDDPAPGELAKTAISTPASGSGPGHQGLRAGDLVAHRYLLRRFLAAGGMGEVWEADDTTLKELVALKTIRPEVASPDLLLRFESEVKLARRVGHRNVCRVFDVGRHQTTDGATVTFLSMELLRGQMLDAAARQRGGFPVDEALPILEQLAAGLDAAHAVGVVHRDFKSPNIFLEPSTSGPPRAVITDFGVARRLDASVRITADPLALMGTPAYMAPEQVEGGDVGAAADVFSLGVVAFELVTAQLPFSGDNSLAMALARLSVPPRKVAETGKTLPPHWDQALARAMARQPADRYSSAAAFVAALSGSASEPPRPRAPRRARRVALGALALAALAGASTAWRATRPAPLRWADLSTKNATSAQARALFHEAMQAFSVSSGGSSRTLSRALQLDPDFTEAQLQLAFIEGLGRTDPSPAAIEALRKAMAQVSRLDARDQRFLAAIEPMLRDPPERAEAWARLTAFVEDFPLDAEGWSALGTTYGDVDFPRSIAALKRARSLDPSSTVGTAMEAAYEYQQGRGARANELLSECLVRNPAATNCLWLSATLLDLEGDCAGLEALARSALRLKVGEPSFWKHAIYAAAVGQAYAPASRGEAIAQLLDGAQGYYAWDAELRRAAEARDFGFTPAVREGCDQVVVSATLARRFLEVGDEAGALAEARTAVSPHFLAQQPLSLGEDETGYLLSVLGHVDGGIDPTEHARRRDEWLARQKKSLGEDAWARSAWLAWLNAWGPGIPLQASPDEAAEAMRVLPQFGALPPLPTVLYFEAVADNSAAYNLAALQLGAGQLAQAEQTLVGAVKRCGAREDPWLHFLLGETRARRGDTARACEAFSLVVGEWGHATPRSVTAERARSRGLELRCPGPLFTGPR